MFMKESATSFPPKLTPLATRILHGVGKRENVLKWDTTTVLPVNFEVMADGEKLFELRGRKTNRLFGKRAK